MPRVRLVTAKTMTCVTLDALNEGFGCPISPASSTSGSGSTILPSVTSSRKITYDGFQPASIFWIAVLMAIVASVVVFSHASLAEGGALGTAPAVDTDQPSQRCDDGACFITYDAAFFVRYAPITASPTNATRWSACAAT